MRSTPTRSGSRWGVGPSLCLGEALRTGASSSVQLGRCYGLCLIDGETEAQ